MLAAGLVGLLAASGACGGRAPDAVFIGTGPTAGVYYPYGQALATIFGTNLPQTAFSAIETSASVDNLKLLHNGGVDLALTLADTLAEARAGTGSFAETGPIAVYSIATLYTNYTHLIVPAESGITQVTDLRGRRVATGAAGSGTEVLAMRILTAAGLDPDADLTRVALNLGPATTALRAGTIDALFWSGGIPTPGVQALAGEFDITLVPHGVLSEALQNRYGPQLYRTHDVLANAYRGVRQDVPVVGVPNILVASDRLPPAFVQRLTEILFGANETLSLLLPEARALAWPAHPNTTPAPFHPGALRYYEAQVWR